MNDGIEVAVFGGGCFWCTEAVFQMLKGVITVASGYAGGHVANPTSDQVYGGNTGHAEVIRIEFDPEKISYETLLTVHFATHDPTTLNRQGNDVGEEYRSVIFYTTPEQKSVADDYVASLNFEEKGRPVVTAVQPLDVFYPAEDYHKNYYEQNKDKPYCRLIINPKVAKVKAKFAAILKENKIS